LAKGDQVNHYYTEKDIRDIVENVLEVPMNAEREGRFKRRIAYYEDPRYGYNIIESVDLALSWLRNGDYIITNFDGGLGLLQRHGGGCAGYFKEGLIEQMVQDGLIYFSKSAYGGITNKGVLRLAKYLNPQETK
jgi:hypothetical protein